MSTKNRIRSGARAGKSNNAVASDPNLFGVVKSTPLKLTHSELHEKISKEVSSAIEPLKTYQDFLNAKARLASTDRDIASLEESLSNFKAQREDTFRTVETLAKLLKEEASAALR
jgi:hypothetical protein